MDDFQEVQELCALCGQRPAVASGHSARRVGSGLPSGKLTTWRECWSAIASGAQRGRVTPSAANRTARGARSDSASYRPQARRPTGTRQGARRPAAQSGDAVGRDSRRGSAGRGQTSTLPLRTQQRGKGKAVFQRKGPGRPGSGQEYT